MENDWYLDNPLVVIFGIAALLIYLGMSLGFIYTAYYLLTLPMRRAERARVFLDIVERGILNGQAPATTIVQAAETRDRLLGRQWMRLAIELRKGKSLTQALETTPRLLSPELAAMFGIGERTGNPGAILPAARALLSDALSQTRGAMNYVILLTLSMSPAIIGLLAILKVRVMPVLQSVFTAEHKLPGFTRFVFEHQTEILLLQCLALGLLWLLLIVYAAGPHLRRVFFHRWPALLDRLALSLPWRKKRLQRDFSFLLSILLDAGVPENEAVRLAGEATANKAFEKLSLGIIRGLEQGQTLPDAVQELDDAGELRWRLTNAAYGKSGFQAALAGWHEHLDARAFQLEQGAAQVLSTALVLYNGILVGGFTAATFLGLINLIDLAVLW
jgi:type II secretory pathway component PulF